MYADNTILKLKTPRDPDEETKEEFPYNLVQVIGKSPVTHSHKGTWEGDDAQGVILRPLTNYAGNLDEPLGKVRTLYDVESVPEVEVVTETRVKVVDATTEAAGPTPEQVFATEAPGEAPEEGQTRGRTPFDESPLGEVINPAVKSPLDA